MEKAGDFEDFPLEVIAHIIEARTGYEWLSNMTKHGTGSVVLVFDTKGFPPYIACKTTAKPLEKRALEGFLNEVKRTLKAQGHPLIAPVAFVVPIAGRPVIFMRYYEQNLREYLARKKALALDEALAMAVQIVKGLLYLREQGFAAHQDLKPENILLEDICREFGAKELPRQLCFRPRIADFGLADALKEAGILGGTNPYRAPEQFSSYLKTEIGIEALRSGRAFDPDIFALGVMITEMITGKHPCGLPSDKALEKAEDSKFWEQWSINGERVVKIENEELKRLVLKMLDPLPTKRPTLEELYEELMKMLKNVNSEVHSKLEDLLVYYDEIAKSYKETLSDIDVLLQVVRFIEIPGTLNLIRQLVEDLKGRIEGLSPPKSPKEVYKYAKVSCTLGRVLAYIDREKYREEIIKYGLNCIDLVSRWKNEIRAEHTPFKGITDYEACCCIVSYGLDLLREVLTEREIEIIIRGKYDEYMKSLYWFNRALIAQDGANYSQALQYIEEALKYEPKNVTLLFFKALLKYEWYQWAKVMGKGNEHKVRELLKEALKELEEVCRLEPTWKEPKGALEKVKAECLREEL